MRVSALLPALLSCALVGGGCGEDRPRPGPPILAIHFQKDSVNSPDSLLGTIDVTDNDGIDSMWVQYDGKPAIGVDGQFQLSFEAPFNFPVDSQLLKGTKIPFSLRGRDIAGYSDELDTFVVVK